MYVKQEALKASPHNIRIIKNEGKKLINAQIFTILW